MITIFNREEILTTYSMDVQANARDCLREQGIPCHIKAVNRNKSSAVGMAGTRARSGSYGQAEHLMYEYIIYVEKKDAETARGILSKELKLNV